MADVTRPAGRPVVFGSDIDTRIVDLYKSMGANASAKAVVQQLNADGLKISYGTVSVRLQKAGIALTRGRRKSEKTVTVNVDQPVEQTEQTEPVAAA